MKATEEKPFAHAMAFYHQDGLPVAWKQAMKFAGKGGRLATMPDIVAARLETKPGALPWETYFTTLTAEYYGFSKNGERILIVAQGIGPMSTLEGVQKAYSWEYQDKGRNHRGGRITAQEFLDLEAGNFGEVSIVDLESYCARYAFPFIQTLRSSEALIDPVLKARFGLLTEDYVKAHTEAARKWHREQAGLDPENKYQLPNHDQFLDRRRFQHERDGAENSDPYILKVDGASNCCYFFGSRHGFREIEEGTAIAHLVSTGRASTIFTTKAMKASRSTWAAMNGGTESVSSASKPVATFGRVSTRVQTLTNFCASTGVSCSFRRRSDKMSVSAHLFRSVSSGSPSIRRSESGWTHGSRNSS